MLSRRGGGGNDMTTPAPVQNDPGAVAKAAIEKTRKKEYQT